MKRNRNYFLIIIFSFLSAQNVDMYLSLIEKGNSNGVIENLPELISKYPSDPGVLYLKSLLTENGDSAIKQYKNIIKNYPESKYAANSAMKIGEYFYARGLYTQSANLLKNIPAKYPRFKEMQRLTDLMMNSFIAIGEPDSAKYYGLIIKSMFPTINADVSDDNMKLSQVFDFKKKKSNKGPYVVQIGAFSSKENAKRLKLQVSQLGHNVSINKVNSNGKTFYAVRINRYKSKKKAEEIGRDIKSKLGVNYRVLYRAS
jgi:tetratricopeptide (TPR) repeat protein